MWLIASVPRPPSRSSILFCVCNTGSEARRCVSAFWVIMLSLTSFSIQLPPTLSIPHHSSHEATLALQVYMSMYVIWHSIFIMQSQTDIPKCMWPVCTLWVRLSFVLTANICDSPSPFMAFLSVVASSSGLNGSAGWMVPWPTSSFTLGPPPWAVYTRQLGRGRTINHYSYTLLFIEPLLNAVNAS